MKRIIGFLCLVSIIAFSLIGCGTFNKDFYEDESELSRRGDTFFFSNENSKSTNLTVESEFRKFIGYETKAYIKKTNEKGSLLIKYKIDIDEGRIKIIVVSPSKNIIETIEDVNEGEVEVSLIEEGNYSIKVVGENANGDYLIELNGDGAKVDLSDD